MSPKRIKHSEKAVIAKGSGEKVVTSRVRDIDFTATRTNSTKQLSQARGYKPKVATKTRSDRKMPTSENVRHHTRKSFLDLYPEIRNTIYQLLIDTDHPTKLLPYNCGFRLVAINSPLLYVNKQISSEFTSLAIAPKPIIELKARELEIRYAEPFIWRMTKKLPRQLARKPTSQPTYVARMIFSLTETPDRGSLTMCRLEHLFYTMQCFMRKDYEFEYVWEGQPPEGFVEMCRGSFGEEVYGALEEWNRMLDSAEGALTGRV